MTPRQPDCGTVDVTVANQPGRPGRVVAVVEDEETIRQTLCFALGREGYQTESFDDGLSAWEAFERALPDLAILDIGIPRMDGLDLCRRLRSRSPRLRWP